MKWAPSLRQLSALFLCLAVGSPLYPGNSTPLSAFHQDHSLCNTHDTQFTNGQKFLFSWGSLHCEGSQLRGGNHSRGPKNVSITLRPTLTHRASDSIMSWNQSTAKSVFYCKIVLEDLENRNIFHCLHNASLLGFWMIVTCSSLVVGRQANDLALVKKSHLCPSLGRIRRIHDYKLPKSVATKSFGGQIIPVLTSALPTWIKVYLAVEKEMSGTKTTPSSGQPC